MKLDKFQEQIFFSTVRVTIPSKSGIGASIGTGFLFGAPLDYDGRFALLLVSNRHVYGDTKRPIVLNFHRRKANGSGPELGQIVTLRDSEFAGIYKAHPDPEVDLACINISFTAQSTHNIFHKYFHPEMLSDFTEDDLLPGVEVWFIGYPENRFDTTHNLPILRIGYIASIPKLDFNSKKQFVIDAQVFPGSSGSPVFAAFGGRFKLLGVVTETMIRNQQLQTVPTGISFGIPQILGLGIVIKAPLVKELIDDVTKEIKLALEKKKDEPIMDKYDKNN